tara:strand:- start:310 stop:705 length:396 start_codon:yes stop_codon:yes gene_type:complete
MDIDLNKVSYIDLNSKQKENYNYHKVASALAEYGYDSMRLNNDWEGADFISVKGDDMIKVQLKGRFTLSKKYENKDLYIAFIEDGIIKIYLHDEALGIATNNITDSKSWLENGSYSMNQTPKHYSQVIKEI